ncbi:unnamed protein product [Acanthoscelides obtectus]|uniref:Uncharacterized protein n=1 Tax=Acanthoscelides obtectus TaxID=200917 RepID=A0A9P0LF19_ACAOB|nr:unnamed protein product [Acanthoscelides obtectus]CAK1635672.1 hypothetical protein AOBTE_LOCUS9429 [Acanthoscelides obtectus]
MASSVEWLCDVDALTQKNKIKNCKMRGKKILEMCQAASLSSTNISPTQEQQTMDFEKLIDQAEMVFDNTDNNVDSRENLEEPRSPKFRFSRTTE